MKYAGTLKNLISINLAEVKKGVPQGRVINPLSINIFTVKLNSENCSRLFKFFLKKIQVFVNRVKFLRKSLKNDLLPDFLKFRAPENVFFWIKLCIIFN